MKQVRADNTLAEVVELSPSSTRILEEFGLDYCCGGSQQLGDACTAIGANLADVLAALSKTQDAQTEAWSSMGLSELVDHLVNTHHAYLHGEFPRLDALANKVVAVHGERHPELVSIQAAYGAVRDDLVPHLMKEEQVLFPMIHELAQATEPPSFHCGSLRNPISRMLAEHDHAGDLLKNVRVLTGGFRPPEDACSSYSALFAGLKELEEDTHLHIYKENSLLFPAVQSLEDQLQGATI